MRKARPRAPAKAAEPDNGRRMAQNARPIRPRMVLGTPITVF
jgi:hypothetical protein